MILALYIIGAIVFVISIIAGFSSGSFIGFSVAMAGGIASAAIFFALARIIENQENIIYKLNYKDEIERKSSTQEKKTCSKCSYKYDYDYSYCPHCSHRE